MSGRTTINGAGLDDGDQITLLLDNAGGSLVRSNINKEEGLKRLKMKAKKALPVPENDFNTEKFPEEMKTPLENQRKTMDSVLFLQS